MILVAITYAVFAILSGLAQSLVSLDVARFFLGVIIGLYFLSALESLGGTATFAMFAALAVVSFASVWWLAPETKGRPLEAIRAYWENGGRWPEPATAAAGRDARFTREGAPASAGDSPTGTRRG
jgi:hypothetical protein